MSDVYRSAASLIVLRPCSHTGADARSPYELLLLHKPRKKDSWQLPQGGVERGENIEQAALRELKEEAGLEDITVLGKSCDVYQYDFPPSFRRFRPDNVCGQRIEYIFGMVPADTGVKVDGQEIDDHKWVDVSDIPRFIKRKEYLDLVHKLYSEAVAAASHN